MLPDLHGRPVSTNIAGRHWRDGTPAAVCCVQRADLLSPPTNALTLTHAGDVLVMEMHVTNFKKRFGICKMQGKGYVDGKVSKRPVCDPFAAAASRFLLALELAAAR